jgi:antitoxin FitA
MLLTCEHAIRMPKMIQLRNVPDDLHHRLKARAALAGMTLSDYLIAEVSRAAERPTLHEMLTRLRARTPVELKTSAARLIRQVRGPL